MTRGKAQYKGSGTGDLIPDFTHSLKQKISTFYPVQDAVLDPVFGHPADEFVEEILAEAWWAKATLHWSMYDSTKNNINAELHDLLKHLEDLNFRLRNLSPDMDRSLGVDADPLGTADKILDLIPFVRGARPLIDKLPKAKTPAQKDRAIAVEMSLRVLRVLKSYGIDPMATAGNYVTGNVSPAIQILKAIGDDIGLVLAPTTWRDILRDAKRM